MVRDRTIADCLNHSQPVLGDAIEVDHIKPIHALPEQSFLSLVVALAQPTRLAALNLLFEAGAAGLPAGALACTLSVPNATMSDHLAVLARVGLVTASRMGRRVLYVAQPTTLSAVRDHLDRMLDQRSD